ncbi:MAG: hypothetical protein U5K28_10710 [Halobacteriales archaeon]|nr:hypothetical protein [Halobacteriales archaeon]
MASHEVALWLIGEVALPTATAAPETVMGKIEKLDDIEAAEP